MEKLASKPCKTLQCKDLDPNLPDIRISPFSFSSARGSPDRQGKVVKGDVSQEDWDEGSSWSEEELEQLDSLEYYAIHNQAGTCHD